MARMIPHIGPTINDSLIAEPTIYWLLAKHLSDDFVVIHSLSWLSQIAREIDGREVPTGEIDFIVLHPKLGILAIEVKGGILKHDRTQFIICKTGERIDPIRQVRRGTHALEPWIKEVVSYGCRVGYALAFPQSVMEGRLIPPALIDITGKKPETICIDKSSLSRLGQRIVEIMSYWQEVLKTRALTTEQINSIVDLICPVVDYSPRWSDRIEEDTKKWLLLTPEQSQCLNTLSQSQRIVIEGRSGTGKTLLATTHARQLAAKGLQTLFLVYNVQLAKQINNDLKDTSVKVLTYHNLCHQAATKIGLAPPDDPSKEWFNVEAPKALKEAIKQKKLPCYDALILDEAQVFHHDWLSSLAEWFTNKSIMACCDETQVFSYEHLTLVHDLVQIVGVTRPFTLTVNMRSPRVVFERLQKVVNTNYEQFSPREDEPDKLTELAVINTLEQLEITVKQLHDEGISSKAIMVIYTGANPLEYLPKIENFVDRDKVIPVLRSRGLEAPVVIVWSNSTLDDLMLTCAYSRSTSRCIAIYNLFGLLHSNESLFQKLICSETPEIQSSIEEIWPPTKRLWLTPIISHTVIIQWSHDWAGWFIDNDKHDDKVSINLWICHILFYSNDPVYTFDKNELLHTPSIKKYAPTQSLSTGLSSQYLSMHWCEQCNCWTRSNFSREANAYYCIDCELAEEYADVPEIASSLKDFDRVLSSKKEINIKKTSIFLIALERWKLLTAEQQVQVQSHLALSGKVGHFVCKLLAGIAVVKAKPDQIIKLDQLCMYCWHQYTWLVEHISYQEWHGLFANGLSTWITHGWLKKKERGIYIRQFISSAENIINDEF